MVAAVLAVLASALIACDGVPVEGQDADGLDCAAICATVVDCGLVDEAACTQTLCPTSDRAAVSDHAACLARAETCGDLALCPCDDACASKANCAMAADAECESTCATLTTQAPAATFQENLCLANAPCDDLPLCSAL